jgi:transposase
VDRHREESVVTDRDPLVVQWVAVIGAVSAQDVMARFGVGRTVGYRRLRALVDHGLLSQIASPASPKAGARRSFVGWP